MRIEVKNLIKKFNSSLAVNNVSFIVEKNKTVGLLGPNGCGKTTSIGMMLGLKIGWRDAKRLYDPYLPGYKDGR